MDRLTRFLPVFLLLAACSAGTAGPRLGGSWRVAPDSDLPTCFLTRSADTTALSPTTVDPKPVMYQTPRVRGPMDLLTDPEPHAATLRFTVKSNGLVDTASVEVHASSDEQTTELAIAVLLASRFFPGCHNGQAVNVRDLQQTFRYGGAGRRVRVGG